jgi:hypothetical protein
MNSTNKKTPEVGGNLNLEGEDSDNCVDEGIKNKNTERALTEDISEMPISRSQSILGGKDE